MNKNNSFNSKKKKNFFQNLKNNKTDKILENEYLLINILNYCTFDIILKINELNKNIYNIILKYENLIWMNFISNYTNLKNFDEINIKNNFFPSLSELIKLKYLSNNNNNSEKNFNLIENNNFEYNNFLNNEIYPETKRIDYINYYYSFINNFKKNKSNIKEFQSNILLTQFLPKFYIPKEILKKNKELNYFNNKNLYSFISTTENNNLEITEITNLKKINVIKKFTGHKGTITDVQYIYDSELNTSNIITSSSDTNIKIWNFQNEKCKSTLNGHSKVVYSIRNCGKNKLISASYDSTIKLWDIYNSNCISTSNSHKNIIYNVRYDGSSSCIKIFFFNN